MRSRCMGGLRRGWRRSWARLKPPIHLERIAPIAHPRPRFHHAAHAVLGQGIELEEQLRVPLHGFEVTDSTPVIHLLHERIPDSRHQLRPPLVLPMLKLDRSWHLESIEELTTDLSLGDIEPGQVHLNHSRHEREGGPLYDEMVPPNSLLEHGQGLGERVAGPRRRYVGP